MAKLVVLLFSLLALQVNSNLIKTPRNLIDEAKQQLEDLKNLVQGDILVAHNDLSTLDSDFLNYGNNVMQEGSVAIEQEEQTINSQLTTIKELANSQGVDISSCTDVREELLERLPADYIDKLKSCVFDKNKEEAVIITNANYIVDTTMTKVHNLEFQFEQCKENLACIAPLLTEIELNKIRLPQNIKSEVLAVQNVLTTMKLSVEACSDSQVSEFITQATSLLQDITECVNDILG